MKNLTFIILVAVLSFVALTIVHAYAINIIPIVNGQPTNITAGNVVVEFDGGGVFNITDVSIKYDDVWGPTMIGLIQNQDPIRTIDGVYLSVQMYDKYNHLIGVVKGYPHSSYILPNQKTAFEIQSGDEDIRNIHRVFIEVLATDWGTSFTSINKNGSYMGIVGVALAPILSEQIGLNQTKGLLLTNITEGSPAEKADLRGGTTTKMFNDREINVGGDIILKIDSKEVSKMEDIIEHISQKHPGDKVSLTIFRDNGTREVDVILGEMPSQPQSQDALNSEELYDECVSTAGKSFCDFLFKR